MRSTSAWAELGVRLRVNRPAALLACVLLLLAAACSSGGSKDAAPGTSLGASASAGASASSGAGGNGAGPGGNASAGASAPAGGGSGGSATQSYPDDGSVGAMARAYLRSAPASELRIEIDYVRGRAPSQSALDHLRSVLLSVVDGRKTVIVEKDQELSASRTTWSIGDVEALSRTARQRHSAGGTVTMWIAYLDGSYAEANGALGVAYKGSAAAIFRERIDDATTAVLLATEIERSVLTHEVGHLLGLVNLGYTSARAHEDAEHPHHSSNQESVMYWQVEDVSIRSLLNGGPPDDFDADDRADLSAMRSGG